MDLLSPLLFILVMATPSATEKQLAECSRFATADREKVAAVDVFGAESDQNSNLPVGTEERTLCPLWRN